MKLLYSTTAAATSAWWESLTPVRQRAYLKTHPNSIYQPGRTGSAPKKKSVGRRPTIKQKVQPANRKKSVANALKHWPISDEVQHAQDALKSPERWKKGKVRRAAAAIRSALGSDSLKGRIKACAKVLAIAGVAIVIGGASLAMGDGGILLPVLAQGAWNMIRDQLDDRKLVSDYTKALRNQLKNPDAEALDQSLIVKKKK